MLSHIALKIRQRPRLYWSAVGLCLAIVWLWSQHLTAQAARQQALWGPSRAVLVANHDLAAGVPLSSRDVKTMRLPTLLVPSEAITSLAGDAVAAVAISRGEPILRTRLGHGGPLAAQLTAGQLAVAIPIPEAHLSLNAGDRVELVATGAGPSGAMSNRLGVARVLELTDRSVTIAVTSSDIEVIATALVHGTITIAVAG